MDTIFALSTAPGKAGVAVIRVSGPEAFRAAEAVCGSLPATHKAALRRFRKRDGTLIDEGIVICFPEGNSFTGENVVEFQTHGSQAVVSLLETELSSISGVRHALAGEFTRRALLNDRLDLTQVEALADLIEAETVAQHSQAIETLSGRLADSVVKWREGLLTAMSLVEAMIDFSDEELPPGMTEDIVRRLAELARTFEREIEGSQVAERVRSGFEIAIIGRPNSGKSTLLNHIAGREAAITSEIAGTTRDVIEVRMDLFGLPVTFLDTAGMRETDDPIEAKGVDLAKQRAERADIRIHLVESSDSGDLRIEDGTAFVGQKRDLASYPGFGLSGVTGEGVSDLLHAIHEYLKNSVNSKGSISNERHRRSLVEAKRCILQAAVHIELGEDYVDLAAEELRRAVHELDAVVGKIGVEDVLGKIFATFCMGK
ncbi:tRNA uridine-5-carboxymethylaminomethyl(34) synthesis GTPase MnmE [Poseidonocella sedimentorum]|uniref:tRNA modification GTPase MnmE n=1 Tax=Poseidonocella sedimentorum TaxID=871652 RepID=A0A1I6D6I7_9RHOB|nr:tRNA uridine-5-carboxymethylaminomethyl(34) synthesis GTPase MnmE [Poseidonocella sedimentorum]SFR01068.1 tRNA modification GTPase [Poseidonocella sedimentorum]